MNTKPLSAKQAEKVWRDCMTGPAQMFEKAEAAAIAAILNGEHSVIERVTEAQAMKAYLDSSVAFTKAKPMDVWLAAYRANGLTKEEPCKR